MVRYVALLRRQRQHRCHHFGGIAGGRADLQAASPEPVDGRARAWNECGGTRRVLAHQWPEAHHPAIDVPSTPGPSEVCPPRRRERAILQDAADMVDLGLAHMRSHDSDANDDALL